MTAAPAAGASAAAAAAAAVPFDSIMIYFWVLRSLVEQRLTLELQKAVSTGIGAAAPRSCYCCYSLQLAAAAAAVAAALQQGGQIVPGEEKQPSVSRCFDASESRM